MRALISDLISGLPQERHKPLRHYQERLDATIAKSFEDAEEKQEASIEDGQVAFQSDDAPSTLRAFECVSVTSFHHQAASLVHLFLAPIEDIHKFPGILVVFDRQFLSLLIDNELASREQNARALAFLIAEIQLEGR